MQKPEHDRELIDALGTYLRRATELVGASRPRAGFGDAVALVVLLKQLRTATAITVLIDRGYANDAGPMLRALAAGTITFAALTQADTEERGYLYARHGRDRHLKWVESVRERRGVLEAKERGLPAIQRTFPLSDEKMVQARDELAKRWDDQLTLALNGRPEPQALGANTRTWSGLNDADLAKSVDALDIYRGIYDVASDSSHQLFTSMLSVINELRTKGTVSIGPTYASATYVAMGVRDCVNRLLTDAGRHFGLASVEHELPLLDKQITEAIHRYTLPSGDQEMMSRARHLLGDTPDAPTTEPAE
jgi:Family of unknown function (DUF5677)